MIGGERQAHLAGKLPQAASCPERPAQASTGERAGEASGDLVHLRTHAVPMPGNVRLGETAEGACALALWGTA